MIPILANFRRSSLSATAKRRALLPPEHRLFASCRRELSLLAVIFAIAIVKSDRSALMVALAFDLPASSSRTPSWSRAQSLTTELSRRSTKSQEARGVKCHFTSKQTLKRSVLRRSLRLDSSASAPSSSPPNQQREQWLAADLERQLETVEPRRETGKEEESSLSSEVLNHRQEVDDVVRGPSRVLVYDTTLRGALQVFVD
jgi:hypothetical protein